MSKLTPVVGVAALAVYSTAAFLLSSNSEISKSTSKISKPGHADFGALRFLTYQTLIAQLVNCALHVLASFVPLLRKPRDLWHSALAFPLSWFVASTFWGVYALDRELIFPRAFDAVFPSWLNHTVHTAIVPVNLLFTLLEPHHYSSLGKWLMVVHLLGYLGLLFHIKSVTGYFVYPYLDSIGIGWRLYVYFASCLVYLLLLYKFGELLSHVLQPKTLLKKQAKPKKQ